jgi:hypothetical protein
MTEFLVRLASLASMIVTALVLLPKTFELFGVPDDKLNNYVFTVSLIWRLRGLSLKPT